MQRSLFHSLVAILAAGVLLLQHAPLVFTGHGGHEHCIHCNGNYCTKLDCDCGHAHPPTQHAHADQGATSKHFMGSHEHSAHHDHAADATDASSSSDAVETYLKTCGAPPSGILTITLDKFVGHSVFNRPSPLSEVPSSARYIGIADQLFAESIFHPPTSGDTRIG